MRIFLYGEHRSLVEVHKCAFKIILRKTTGSKVVINQLAGNYSEE